MTKKKFDEEYESLEDFLRGKDITDLEIEFKEDKYSILHLLEFIKEKQIILDPPFQRNYVWKPSKVDNFIETLLLNIPLPPIYFNFDENGKFITIDGKQRISAINIFCNWQHKLGPLTILDQLSNLTFEELPARIKNSLLRRTIQCYFIKPATPTVLIFDLFRRINTGGTNLNKMEIRNGILSGHGSELLLNISLSEEFKKFKTSNAFSVRMKDREALLRFYSLNLWKKGKLDFKGIDQLLDDGLAELNKLSEDEVKKLYIKTCRHLDEIFELFGAEAFSTFNVEKKMFGSFSFSIFETVLYYFWNNKISHSKISSKQILASLTKLYSSNQFQESIGRRSYTLDAIKLRFELMENTLRKIL